MTFRSFPSSAAKYEFTESSNILDQIPGQPASCLHFDSNQINPLETQFWRWLTMANYRSMQEEESHPLRQILIMAVETRG